MWKSAEWELAPQGYAFGGTAAKLDVVFAQAL